MTVYVSEIRSEMNAHEEDLLRIVRNGVDVRLPLDRREGRVTLADDHPEWVPQFVKARGYTVVEPSSDASPPPANQHANG